MTKEEAIKNIEVAKGIVYSEYAGINDDKLVNDVNDALDMAIDALDHEKELIDALGLSIHVQSLKNSILEEEKHKINKIRAEIEEQRKEVSNKKSENNELQAYYDGLNDGLKDARDIIDKYRKGNKRWK